MWLVVRLDRACERTCTFGLDVDEVLAEFSHEGVHLLREGCRLWRSSDWQAVSGGGIITLC